MSFARQTIALSSIAPDLIEQDAPADVWNTGSNIVFRNGEAVRCLGEAPTLPGGTAGALVLQYIVIDDAGYWVYATNTGIYVHDGTSESDITPAGGWTGDAGARFTACTLNGIVYINASDRDPVYWAGNPGVACQPLPDWPAGGRCYALRAHKNFLFAIGFWSEGAQRVRWSDAAEAGTVPQAWAPASDNLAGFLDLAPLSSPCLDGATLRDSFVVYKQESVWAFDFIGGTLVFAARQMFHEYGLANTNALTRGIDDVHLFIGNSGDVYLTDGVNVRSVLDGRAQRTFYQNFSQNVSALFSAVTLAREKLGILMFPTEGSNFLNQAIAYDFPSGDISFRDIPDALCAAEGGELRNVGDLNTWDGDSDPWDSDSTQWGGVVRAQTLDDIVMSTNASGYQVLFASGAADYADGPVSARLEKAGLAFGDAQSRKMVARIWPKLLGTPGDQVTFRLGGQEITGGPVSLSPPVVFTIGEDRHLDTFCQGRFISLEVSSEGGDPWRLGSIDAEVRLVGGW